ncbi:hypothetical protein, partial [Morganella morganii]|uniref:hypothetical protein n=1 Tax=Morganella morganii TaxID=582 RepID=UPI00195483FB
VLPSSIALAMGSAELDFLRDHALANNENLCRYVTTKRAFVQFGAQVVTSGFRDHRRLLGARVSD